MSCALTQGLVLDCRDSYGGVKEVYIAEWSSVSSTTVALGVITALTLASAKQFYKYALVKGTSEAEEAPTPSEENGSFYVKQTLKLVINKLQTSVRNEILLLAKNRLMICVVDQNDQAWMYGYEKGILLAPSSAKTGRAAGDRNGYELSFEGMEKSLAPNVQASVVSTLTTPGS